LYESCGQQSDALGAYMRAMQLEPNNAIAAPRVTALTEAGGATPSSAPPPIVEPSLRAVHKAASADGSGDDDDSDDDDDDGDDDDDSSSKNTADSSKNGEPLMFDPTALPPGRLRAAPSLPPPVNADASSTTPTGDTVAAADVDDTPVVDKATADGDTPIEETSPVDKTPVDKTLVEETPVEETVNDDKPMAQDEIVADTENTSSITPAEEAIPTTDVTPMELGEESQPAVESDTTT
jgi:hypothetical protein